MKTRTQELPKPAYWTQVRLDLLEKEKELTRLRDELCRQRRALPAVEVEKDYAFEGPEGKMTLADLFGSQSQLIVYHFMFDESWDEGCPSCSLVTDSLDPTAPHLAARDTALVLVSRASLDKLLAFRRRMGWSLPWVSSLGTDFNRDFHVCTDESLPDGRYRYNYHLTSGYGQGELPGLSVFRKDDSGIFHTYSMFGRGLEDIMGTYSLLDRVPKGRDEEGLRFGMEWVRHHDRYEHSAADGCCDHSS